MMSTIPTRLPRINYQKTQTQSAMIETDGQISFFSTETPSKPVKINQNHDIPNSSDPKIKKDHHQNPKYKN